MTEVDLDAVQRRLNAYRELWPSQEAGSTLSERVAAAKRCANDVPDLAAEVAKLRIRVAMLESRCGLVLSHFDQAEAAGYPRSTSARALVHLPTLRGILTDPEDKKQL